MPHTDVIDDFSNGATGTLTDINGATVGYTVTGTSPNTNWQTLVGGARVNGNGTQRFTLTFDNPVVGATMRFSGSDATEPYYVEVNGATVDLNVLIANGDVTFTQSGAATHVIRADGGINGGHYSDGSIGDLTFNFPVTSLGAYGSGANSGNWDFVEVGIDNTTFDIVCFAAGTKLIGAKGKSKVEDLRPGDVLASAFGEPAVVRWVGSRKVSALDLKKNKKLLPVRISKGALGNGLPKRDMWVSRQHRVVVASRIVQRIFNEDAVLVPAIKLVGFPGIAIDETIQQITYFHLLCERHAVLQAEGAPLESLLLGPQAQQVLEDGTAIANAMNIPKDLRKTLSQIAALKIATGARLRDLLERHKKNAQPMLQRLDAKAVASVA